MSGSQGSGENPGASGLWRPAPEIAAEVSAALAAAGEVVAAAEEEPEAVGGPWTAPAEAAEDLDEFEDFDVRGGETTPAGESAVVVEVAAEAAAETADEAVAVAEVVAEVVAEAAVAVPVPAPTSVPETVAAPVPAARGAEDGPEPAPDPVPIHELPSGPSFAAAVAAVEGAPVAAPPAFGAQVSADQVSRHIARAEALAELGRRQQALDVLNELIVAGADDVRVWRALAAVYLDTGDGDKALRAADWVVTFAPEDEWGHRLRSSALRLLQRPEEAVHAASEAVRLDPDVWQGHAALAMALHNTGDLSAAAAAARTATAIAEEQAPTLAPEVGKVQAALQKAADKAAESVEQAADKAEHKIAEKIATGIEETLADGLGDLEPALTGRPGSDEESLSHISTLLLRGLEFSAGAGWLVSFGGIAIPGFDLRFLIPVAVLVILGAFLFRPARKAGRNIWRYLVEYLWQDANTRYALLMALAAHVWMIAGTSVGHVQGGSALGVGLLTHLAGRTVLAKKAPELNPIRRGRDGEAAAPAVLQPAE